MVKDEKLLDEAIERLEQKLAALRLRKESLPVNTNYVVVDVERPKPTPDTHATMSEEDDGDEADDDEDDEAEGDDDDEEESDSDFTDDDEKVGWTAPEPLEVNEARAPVPMALIPGLIAGHLAVPSSSDDDSGSEEEEEEGDEGDSDSEWEDEFPYEDNVFRLSHHYSFHKRIATNHGAVVYQAFHKKTGEAVAIKLVSGGSKTPQQTKLINLVSAVQGHENVVGMIAWHWLPQKKCHALVTQLLPNWPVKECLFGQPTLIRQYLKDLINACLHCHSRGVLYRDIKTSNVLWNHETQRAILIDFDVATFHRPKVQHTAVVGSDGYMAPEVAIRAATKDKFEEALSRAQSADRRTGFDSDSDNDYGPAERKLRDKYRRDMAKLTSYGLKADAYSAGIVLGQLLFKKEEGDVNTYGDDHEASFGEYVRRRIFLMRRRKSPKFTLGHALCLKMTTKSPATRYSLQRALEHPYFTASAEEAQKLVAKELKGRVKRKKLKGKKVSKKGKVRSAKRRGK